MSGLDDCYLLCEDVVNVNLTQPDMSPIKKDLLKEYGFKSDTMEFYEIQQLAVIEASHFTTNLVHCYRLSG